MAAERFNEEAKVFERRCEDCSKWQGTWEFPKSGRTWVCKVCQGMKAPKTFKNPSIYKEYVAALRELDAEKKMAWNVYNTKREEIERRRSEVISKYYSHTKD